MAKRVIVLLLAVLSSMSLAFTASAQAAPAAAPDRVPFAVPLTATGDSGRIQAADVSPLAEYAPASYVHLEPGTPGPRLSGGNWFIAEGTHFRYNDYVQVGKSRLIFQQDGNLVLYDEIGRARWASGTDHRGQEAIFQQDGNLVVYVSRGRPFASRTCCFPDLEFSVRADGSIRILQIGTEQIRWQTSTAH